jgi:linoleoyl-CoA desaturase
MWNIYGKKYDLNSFIEKHPGGKFILEKTQGLEDITALFETYHAFSDIEKIKETLQKYEIKENDQQQVVEYKPDFTEYRKLTKRVQEIFPDRESIKANCHWLINNVFTISLAAFTFYLCYLSNAPFIYKLLSQIVYSTCESSISFNILHDGSHYGISKHPNVNFLLSKFVNSFYLWNSNAWFYHHVYYHHSFTGLENDPDDKLYTYEYSEKIINLLDKQTFIKLFYTIIPGQQAGQSLLYFLIPITGKYYFAKKPFPKINYYDIFDYFLICSKIYLIYCAGIIQMVMHFFIISLLYFINIYPNHTSYETKIENHYEGNDWAKMQICNSGNFLMDNLWWTRIFGGINYQIEHHLFPNISSIHYPVVSKIVQEYCKENNIPYVNKATLYEAYNSFNKYLHY